MGVGIFGNLQAVGWYAKSIFKPMHEVIGAAEPKDTKKTKELAVDLDNIVVAGNKLANKSNDAINELFKDE